MPTDTASSTGPGPGSRPVDVLSIVLILVLLLSASAVNLWTLERLLRQPITASQATEQDSAAIVAAAALRNPGPVDSTQRQDTTRRAGDSVPPLTVAKGADSMAARVTRLTQQRDSQLSALRQATIDSTLAASRAAADARLFIIVLLSGALGGLLHSVRSFVWYVGNRELKWSWVPTYITLPVTSALLAATMYFVVRAGFLGFQGSGDLNAYGFAAASALIGLFSQAAILKLKEVAETLFTRPPQGADARPEVASKPAAPGAAGNGKVSPLAGDTSEGVAPIPVIISATLRNEGGKPTLTIEGNGFRKQSQVLVNTTKVPSLTSTSKKITVQLPDALAAGVALKAQVVTPGPGGGESSIVDVVADAVGARDV